MIRERGRDCRDIENEVKTTQGPEPAIERAPALAMFLPAVVSAAAAAATSTASAAAAAAAAVAAASALG